jgi:Helix-turn-helix family
MPNLESTARRMFRLTEPIGGIAFSEAPHEAMMALGMRNYWDGYFAGRAAPLGRAPAEVVHAVFYNFAPGEVARHIPRVWDTVTPEQAIAARQEGSVAALRRILGDLADGPGIARAADLATRAGTSAPTEGRALYAAVRTLPVPEEPLARLWHASMLLREHRGDGHIAALVTEGIGGIESHVLHAVSQGMPAEKFGRVHHLPAAQLGAVVDGMRERGLLVDSARLTDAGREKKARIEAITDDLAAAPWEDFEPAEIDRLAADLEPLSERLEAAGIPKPV